jgi:hypothetical protein
MPEPRISFQLQMSLLDFMVNCDNFIAVAAGLFAYPCCVYGRRKKSLRAALVVKGVATTIAFVIARAKALKLIPSQIAAHVQQLMPARDRLTFQAAINKRLQSSSSSRRQREKIEAFDIMASSAHTPWWYNANALHLLDFLLSIT